MQYLLDTHILIWYLDGSNKLPDKIKDLISDESADIRVSIISLWEIAIKLKLNKLDTNIQFSSIQDFIISSSFGLINIKVAHLNTLIEMALYHNDPFDRLLIAQAIAEDMTLISVDKYFSAYPVKLL